MNPNRFGTLSTNQSGNENTREPEIRPAGVELCGISFQRVILTGKMPIPQLQFDRFHFSDESLVVVGQERTDHVEHGVTEATDIHDVSSLASLDRLVRLQIDVDQLR